VRVLVIEDDAALAKSVEMMLRREGMQVDLTDLGEDGLEIGKLYDHDIIILDLNLPDVSGYEVLRRMRDARIKTPVLIMSGDSGIEQRIKGLGYGADDFVPKPVDMRELIARIRAISRRSQGHAASVIEVGRLRIDIDNKRAETIDGKRVPLTVREFAIVEVLALRKGSTVSKDALMAQLYSSEVDEEPEQKIIDVFVHKIRKKIEATTGEQCIETVWGRGYAMKDPAEVRAGPR
jgi:two-component system, cell cycle response regulator CtrA